MLAVMAFSQSCAQAQDIALPAPNITGGMPLMEALKNRKSDREFSSREIPLQVLSDVLWSAVGINRAEGNMRTYASASNRQDVDVYLAMEKGFYKYDPTDNKLMLVVAEDLRLGTGNQPFVTDSPVTLVYVGDFTKWDGIREGSVNGVNVSVGAVSQSVYLYCASAGLNAVVRGSRGDLFEKAGLNPETQMIMLAHTIGYPKE